MKKNQAELNELFEHHAAGLWRTCHQLGQMGDRRFPQFATIVLKQIEGIHPNGMALAQKLKQEYFKLGAVTEENGRPIPTGPGRFGTKAPKATLIGEGDRVETVEDLNPIAEGENKLPPAYVNGEKKESHPAAQVSLTDKSEDAAGADADADVDTGLNGEAIDKVDGMDINLSLDTDKPGEVVSTTVFNVDAPIGEGESIRQLSELSPEHLANNNGISKLKEIAKYLKVPNWEKMKSKKSLANHIKKEAGELVKGL